MPVKGQFYGVLSLINNSNLQKSNFALYQALTNLLDESDKSQKYLESSVQAVTDQVSATFLSGSSTDRLNYKPQDSVNHLIFWVDSTTGKLYIFNPGTGTWSLAGGADPTATYITSTNESSILPNSRQLIAGTGITLNTSVPNQITISSGGGYMPMNIGVEFMTIDLLGNPMVCAWNL